MRPRQTGNAVGAEGRSRIDWEVLNTFSNTPVAEVPDGHIEGG